MEADYDEDLYQNIYDAEDGRAEGDENGDEGFGLSVGSGGGGLYDIGDDEERYAEQNENLDFAPDFRLLTNQPLGDQLSRRLRSPREIALDQINGILSSSDTLTMARRNAIVQVIERIPVIQNLNLELLVIAAQYILEDLELNKSSFDRFYKSISKSERGLFLPRDLDLNKYDMIRYITFLQKFTS